MHTQYQLTFIIRKSRSKKTSDSDVYMRITVNNKRSDTSISRKVDPRKWSSSSEKALGKSPEATELNNYINVLRNKIKNIHQDLIEKNKTVSSKSILDQFKGVNKKKPKMTLEAFKEHNEQMDRLSGKSISKSTAKRYWTCYNHLEQFLKEVYKTEDFRMKDIDHQFITRFEYFLKLQESVIITQP
jgi:hypothetical protein